MLVKRKDTGWQAKTEEQIGSLLLTGASNRELAQVLGLSEGRVRNILSLLYRKFGIAAPASGHVRRIRLARLFWNRNPESN
jgi:DNA-binding NarL/FixJ family response regulator